MKRFSLPPFLLGLLAVFSLAFIAKQVGKRSTPAISDEPAPRRAPLSALFRPPDDSFAQFRAEFEESGDSYNAYKRALKTVAGLDSTHLGSMLEAEENSLERTRLIQIWAHGDPRATLDYLKTWSRDHNGKAKSMEQALELWAKRDPEVAEKWLEEFLGKEDPKQDLFGLFRALKQGLVRGVAKTDPHSALAILHKLKVSGFNIDITFDRTEDWNAVLQRDGKSDFLLPNWFTNDPQACVAWLNEQNPTRLTDALGSIGDELVRYADDPLKLATDYWGKLAGRRKSQVGTQFVGALNDRDPNLAAQWLNQNEDEPELDSARGNFVRELAPLDPASAYDWTASIHDPQKRANAEKMVFQTWSRFDAEAAETFFLAEGWDREKLAELRAR